jgi:hypothetical protein
MMNRATIEKWVSERPNIAERHDAFRHGVVARFTNMIHDCHVALAPSWVSADDFPPSWVDGAMYWVKLPNDEIHMMHLNNYKHYFKVRDFWQTLGGEDLSMIGTDYMIIEKPSEATT